MATKITALCFLASIPVIKGYCPPLMKAINDADSNDLDYFTVHSQADADKLKTCHVFKGKLVITGRNASASLIIDGPRCIEGELTMALYSDAENPLFTSVSMKSLVSIAGNTEIYSQQEYYLGKPVSKDLESNLGVLDFSALKSVLRFTTRDLICVHTLNFLSLEYASGLSFGSSPELHTIEAPKLQSSGSIHLFSLPSLKTTPSFTAGLKDRVGEIILTDTSLTDISFPNIEVLSDLAICENKHLNTLSLLSLTRVTRRAHRGGGMILVSNNNPNLIISLTKLTTVTGHVQISNVRGIDIPELRVIGNSLFVGVINHDRSSYQRFNCRATYFTNFSAPKLRRVEGRIEVDASPVLKNISFPVLKSTKEIIISNTAATAIENGVSMPSFRHVESVEILGTESRCDYFDSFYCRGGVSGNYSCGKIIKGSITVLGIKTWPSFPPSCAEKGLLGLSLPKETFNMTNYAELLSQMILIDCYQNLEQYCVRGYTLKGGFLAIMGLIVVATMVMRSAIRRLRRRRRWQITQTNSEPKKVVTRTD